MHLPTYLFRSVAPILSSFVPVFIPLLTVGVAKDDFLLAPSPLMILHFLLSCSCARYGLVVHRFSCLFCPGSFVPGLRPTSPLMPRPGGGIVFLCPAPDVPIRGTGPTPPDAPARVCALLRPRCFSPGPVLHIPSSPFLAFSTDGVFRSLTLTPFAHDHSTPVDRPFLGVFFWRPLLVSPFRPSFLIGPGHLAARLHPRRFLSGASVFSPPVAAVPRVLLLAFLFFLG